jgi:hypothetical protein
LYPQKEQDTTNHSPLSAEAVPLPSRKASLQQHIQDAVDSPALDRLVACGYEAGANRASKQRRKERNSENLQDWQTRMNDALRDWLKEHNAV